MAANDRLEQLLEQQIAAQNRTTHAVRALASYVLYQVGWALLGGVVIGLALVNQDPGMAGAFMFIGALLIIIGFFHAYTVAMQSLSKSEIKSVGEIVTKSESPTQEVQVSSQSDFEIAVSRLNSKEKRLWEQANRPALQGWLAEGQPDFTTWLSNKN